MAFLPFKFDGSCRPQSLEYLPAAAITPKVGMALTWDTSGDNGVLNKTGTTGQPDYIAMTERSAALTAGDYIPVLKVTPDIIFETKLSADYSGIKAGTKVVLSSDGLGLGTSTSSGKALVESFDGKTAGAKVRVRFA